MYIRHQTSPAMADLNGYFLAALMDVWNTHGIDACRCYALGA